MNLIFDNEIKQNLFFKFLYLNTLFIFQVFYLVNLNNFNNSFWKIKLELLVQAKMLIQKRTYL